MEKATGGHVESRLTIKNTGHPLLENRKLDFLYLDESGTPAFSDPNSVFALGGVSLREEDARLYIKRANRLKMQFFGRTDITFHEPQMRRHDDNFSFGGNKERRQEFDAALRALVKQTRFRVFGVGIRKTQFQAEFVDTNCDPYLPTNLYSLALMLLLERYVNYIALNNERRLGRVHIESIGSHDDAEHQVDYADLVLHGTQFVSGRTFQCWVEPGCRFSVKHGSDPSELSDLVAREVFEWTRADCGKDPPYWDILNSKAYVRGDGLYGKFGIKVFPATGVEDAIREHRLLCGATDKN